MRRGRCASRIMRGLVTFFIHLVVTFARQLGPGGLRSVIAESLLAKHQLLILNRSRERTVGKMHLRLTFTPQSSARSRASAPIRCD